MPPDDIELAERAQNGHKNGYENGYDDEERALNGNEHKKDYEPVNGNDAEDESDQDDDEALLVSPGRARSLKRPELHGLWAQVKNIVLESAPTLLLTTIGLLFTGELLDQVSKWRAMREVDQLIMIIPVVLNLKGNLEMNLSARLGTAANVGELDDPPHRRKLITGNLTLLQVQATIVSFVAACVSLLLGLVVPRKLPDPAPPPDTRSIGLNVLAGRAIHHPLRPGQRKSGLPTFIMVASTAMTAACLSSVILGSFMCFLIVLCRKFGRDPDNIAPPIASCLGDLVTLVLIGLVSSVLIGFLHTPVPFIVAILVVCSATFCFYNTRRNEHVRDLLKQGWTPLFGAMVISSATGIVLDLFVSRYEGFALLAVVISGLPGSVGAIFVSRLSTSLHLQSTHHTQNEPSAKVVMITLILITLPVEVIFLSILHGLGWLHLPFIFVAFSVLFFCCAVTASLFIARWLTTYLWSKSLDPDMYAMPIHSALMDLIGQLLLVVCFEIVQLMGAKVSVKQ